MRLHLKISVLITLITLFTGITSAVLTGRILHNLMLQELQDKALIICQTTVEHITHDVANGETVSTYEALMKLRERINGFEYAYVYDFDNKIFVHTFEDGFPRALIEEDHKHSLDEGTVFREYLTVDDKAIIDQSMPLIKGLEARLHIGMDVNYMYKKIIFLQRQILVFSFVIALIGIAISITISHRITLPLSRLVYSMKAYGQGKKVDLVKLNSGGRELIELNEVFQKMIADRALSDRILQQSEAQMRTLVETIPDLIWLKSPDGVYLTCNPKFERFFSATEKEIIGKTDYDFVEKKMADFFREKDKIAMEAGGPSINEEEVVYADDGHHEFLETIRIPMNDSDGNIIGILGIARDITQRKQAEETIRLNEERLNSILQTNPNPIVLYDTDDFPQFINPSFTEVFGWTLSEIQGRDVPFVPDDEEHIIFFKVKEICSNANQLKFLSKRITKSNKILDVSISVAIYKNTQGEEIGLIVNFTDITEQIQLKNQLIQAQKMESVGRLAGGVAHDFNNMLSIILGNLEIMVEDIGPDHPCFLNLMEIQTAGQRSADLTRQLLSFARKQTISPKILNPNHVIESMLKMLKRLIGEDIDLLWYPQTDLWSIKIDPAQIDQMLANLCVNARDAIKDVGKITIETGNVSFNESYCREHIGFIPGSYIVIGVSDNGCGMDRETTAHLFEPFFTTKKRGEGTGLGLATVYGIIKQNNGFISVYSEPGQGTTFKIYLPRHFGNSGQKAEKEVQKKSLNGNETILLVEDEDAILQMTRQMLERLGYTVLAANTPDEAIRISNVSGTKINLLITDVVMPSMNGRELAEKILLSFPNMKCLYMSGYTANVIAHRGILDEGLNFINKPFSKQDLSMKLREILDLKMISATSSNFSKI